MVKPAVSQGLLLLFKCCQGALQAAQLVGPRDTNNASVQMLPLPHSG